MAISHCYWHLPVKNGNFPLLLIHLVFRNGNFTLLLISTWSRMAISHCYWYLVVKNGNFTLVMTSNGEEWQVDIANRLLLVSAGNFTIANDNLLFKNGNLTLLMTSTFGQEWQFHNCYWYIEVKNGNLTLLLTYSCQDWQYFIATDI